jgi:hypothetical protein
LYFLQTQSQNFTDKGCSNVPVVFFLQTQSQNFTDKGCSNVPVVFLLLGDSPVSEFYVPSFWNRESVPISGYIKFRRRGESPK